MAVACSSPRPPHSTASAVEGIDRGAGVVDVEHPPYEEVANIAKPIGDVAPPLGLASSLSELLEEVAHCSTLSRSCCAISPSLKSCRSESCGLPSMPIRNCRSQGRSTSP